MAIDKPDFSCGSGGIVDPNFIPPEVKVECMLHLQRSKLTKVQKAALLGYANDMGQMIVEGELATGKSQRSQIEAVRDAAHALLVAMNKMHSTAKEALHAHTEYLAWGSAPPVELPQTVLRAIQPKGDGQFLSDAWDWAAALEMAAEYASQQFKLDKNSKPQEMRARGFVSMLAEYIRDTTGELPPKDPASWFAALATTLGASMGLEIGPRLVASGVKAIQ